MKKKKLPPVPQDLIRRKDVMVPDSFPADPMGSYTGRPIDEFGIPVQDADEL